MYVVVVRFTVRPDSASQFHAAVEQQAANSLRSEVACRQFDVCYDPTDETRVLLYELYDDRAAFDAHLATAHFAEFNALVTPWVVTKELNLLTTASATHPE
jgi:quinol monooxygenase YgiN